MRWQLDELPRCCDRAFRSTQEHHTCELGISLDSATVAAVADSIVAAGRCVENRDQTRFNDGFAQPPIVR